MVKYQNQNVVKFTLPVGLSDPPPLQQFTMSLLKITIKSKALAMSLQYIIIAILFRSIQ